MTQDEIIEMARQAGFSTGTQDYANGIGGFKYVTPIGAATCLVELENFAKLVAAKERKACETICDDLWGSNGEIYEAVEAIRARQ